MINIKDKKNCCGCTACQAACPQQCVSMKADKEGFLYPVIDAEKCVNCRICENVCPVLSAEKQKNKTQISASGLSKETFTEQVVSMSEKKPESYIAFLNDRKIREKSTSGGFFTALSQYVISKNGKVYGVEIDKNKVVRHAAASTEKQLAKFRGSKYVQSEQCGIYSKIKSDLLSGITVLYTGAPCQIEGLYNFLGRDYENLITLDIFCHGVGSPEYWRKYVEHMERKYSAAVKGIRFREKTYGYNSACMAVYFENGKVSKKGHDDDLYWAAFSKCYIFRPSCYDCKFKTINHRSDFSIGDFWDLNSGGDKFADSNGCSLVLVHSCKGRKVLNYIKENITIKDIDLKKALLINGGHQASMLINTAPIPDNYKEFAAEAYENDITDIAKKYMPLSFTQRIKCNIKPVLYKMGVLDKLKRIKR